MYKLPQSGFENNDKIEAKNKAQHCRESLSSSLPVTKNSTMRVLPINDTLCRTLMEMPEKSGYVFGNGNGGHIGNIKHSFTSACRKAGITDFRFHDLRHIYASHLAMRGVHIRAFQELLGHKTLISPCKIGLRYFVIHTR